MTLPQYLSDIADALENRDGVTIAELVSFKHPHSKSAIFIKIPLRDLERYCAEDLESPLDEVVAAHVRAVQAVADNNFSEAFACQCALIQSFLKGFQSQKDENWGLPILMTLTHDLRQLALQADKQCDNMKAGEMMEKAADVLMSCFRVCVTDTRSSLDNTKRWGTLHIVNQLFKIYFKIKALHLCKPLIRAIESSTILEQFRISEFVTYRYFTGCKAMFDGDYKLASDRLTFAFEKCHRHSRKNKHLILIYLIPVRMLLGGLPSPALLQKYHLEFYAPIAKALREGNIRELDQSIREYERIFVAHGIYLILEKLKIIAYRNLFKRVFLLLGTHQLPLQAFTNALNFADGSEEVPVEEVQCIIANLIDKNYIKGYISHAHQKLVVSKKDPFPQCNSV